ncbi:hypothetical protein LLG96_08050 [bacterium]|nr:hypothetical protein [bacterium]
MPYTPWLIMIASVIFFYRLGKYEYKSEFLGVLSILLWFASLIVFRFGLAGCLLVQGAIFAGMIGWSFIRKKT